MACQGKAGYQPSQGMGERMHVIGPGDRPVLMLKKKEVPELFTPLFWHIYTLWGFFRKTMNPPGATWDEINPEIMQAIISVDNHFDVNFSKGAIVIQYLESIIKHLRALGGKR